MERVQAGLRVPCDLNARLTREAQKQGFPNANGSQFIDRGPHSDTIEEAREAALNGPIF